MNNEEELLNVLNAMIAACEPFTYEQMNCFVPQEDNRLITLEKTIPQVGIAVSNEQVYGMSTLSIIATITDLLCGKRLAWQISQDGYIVGVQWYKE